MFHQKIRNVQLARCFVERDQWRVAFAHCDNVFAIDLGQQFAEAPDAACILG